ncbi:sensor domain-containing protein [Robertmurraya korlensis]|uniref:sensor domain-containing protein n=1 Tax=Robertmurraya korlensis TaxID=519977 RepID=UPI00082686F2|nr:EAL domain-containing protein [Robertmurraya korlensis]
MTRIRLEKDHLFDAYKSLFDFNPDASYAVDLEGKFILFNKSAEELSGYTLPEAVNTHFVEIITDDYKEAAVEKFSKVLNGNRETMQVKIRHKNQSIIQLYLTAVPIIIEGQIQGIIGFAKDMTESNKIQEELRHSQSQLEKIFHSIDVCLWSWDCVLNKAINVSPACFNISGYTAQEFIDDPALCKNFIHPDDKKYVIETQKKLLNGEVSQFEYRIINKKGHVRWVSNYTVPYFNESGALVRVDGVITDVDQRRKAEEQLQQYAYYDYLTGLPNRRLFDKKLTIALENAKQEKKKVMVLYLDLDRFKYINDSLGHAVGDQLLQIVGKRLKGCLYDEDVISRQGGDEFAVLIENIIDDCAFEDIPSKILQVIQQPIMLNKMKFTLSASIGISVYPDHGANVDSLIMKADQAMYLAKEKGKNTYQVYHIGMTSSISRKMILEQGLHNVLKDKELSLHYQPIMDTSNNKLVGFETLVRWENPMFGWVPPSEFIPVAEDAGLIVPIGKWIIETAIKHCKDFHSKGFELYVSVNVSAKQLEQGDFVDWLKQALDVAELSPAFLKIEVTEGTAMTNVEDNVRILQLLEDLGVDIFLDDFGTGYSSLSYLRKFPIKTLKIDQSFVRDIEEDKNQEEIIKAIIGLANSLGMDVVAEGVETLSQISFLEKNGCRTMQGYFFSKPAPYKEVLEVLTNSK